MSFTSVVAGFEDRLFRHRAWVLVVFAGLTALLAVSAARLRMDAGFSKLLPLKHEYMQAFAQYQREFGGANQILVALHAKEGDIFTPDFMETLRQVTDEVFFIPGVDRSRVSSLWTPDVRYREIVEEGLAGGNIVPADYEPTPEGVARVRSNVLKSEYVGRLVANDFSGAIVSAELLEIDPTTDERLDYMRVARDLEGLREKYAGDRVGIHIVGFAKMVGDMAEGAARVVLFFGVAFLITAVLVYAYTRSARRTAILLACASIAVAWQLGLLPVLGLGIDPMGILVPFLVFAIAVSHGVQMVSANGAELFDGKDSLEAARASFRRLVIPSLTALATDVMGFVTILLIDIRIIQEMAFTAGLGVAAIIVTNLFLLPVLLSYVPATPAYRLRLQRRADRLAPVWKVLSRVAEPKPAAAVIGLAAVLLALGAWRAGDIRIGDLQRGVPELRPESRYNADTAAITDAFAIGVDVITVFAETEPEACVDYEVMSAIDGFEWHMQNVKGVQSSVSLASVAKVINAAWNEGNPKWQILPRNKQVMAQSLGYVATSTGLLNKDCSVMPVYLFTDDHKAETISGIVDAAKEYRQQYPGGRVNFRLAGGNVGVMAATNEEVVVSQTPILLYVFAAVVLFCLIAFRSLRATLCILLPLGLVSLLGYALMAMLGIGLKVNTLPIVALGVGVGVDYGIYIYGRLRDFLEQGEPLRRAYELTLDITGNGVLLTGFSLAVGVATWIFSPLQFQADMGILLTFLFLVNMLGAVFLLPALASWLFPAQARVRAAETVRRDLPADRAAPEQAQ